VKTDMMDRGLQGLKSEKVTTIQDFRVLPIF